MDVEGTQSGEGSPADTQASKSPKDAKGVEGTQAWPDEGTQAWPAKKRKGYDFRCGQVLMATPYGQRQLVLHGRTPEEIRQALGFSPEFMAECFRVALNAQPLKKDFKPFESIKDYQEKMHAMVSRDQIQHLGDGWMIWARVQATEWEQMVHKGQHDEAALQPRL